MKVKVVLKNKDLGIQLGVDHEKYFRQTQWKN